MRIIPAIDIYNDMVVRLEKGQYDKMKVYDSSPLDVAEDFLIMGFSQLHIVDLEGSRDGKLKILSHISEIKDEFQCVIQCGGGIRNESDALALAEAGADYLIIGSMAVKDQAVFESLCRSLGPERIIAAVDSVNGQIAIQGWQNVIRKSIDEHINYCLSLGITQFLCTDIQRDGMLTGVNIGLYSRLKNSFPKAEFIASGGLKNMKDIYALKPLDLFGVILGKAWYENKITREELMSYAG